MQLHSQLPELREGGAGRGEDLSNLGAEQHYGGPAARRPSPASDPPAPRPARTSREPGRGPTLPWPPGSAVREGGRTLVDADVMAPRTSSRRRSAATTTRAGNHGEPGGRPLGSRAGSPALLAADWPKPDLSPSLTSPRCAEEDEMEDVASLPAGFSPLPSKGRDCTLRLCSVFQSPLPANTDTRLRRIAYFYCSPGRAQAQSRICRTQGTPDGWDRRTEESLNRGAGGEGEPG